MRIGIVLKFLQNLGYAGKVSHLNIARGFAMLCKLKMYPCVGKLLILNNGGTIDEFWIR